MIQVPPGPGPLITPTILLYTLFPTHVQFGVGVGIWVLLGFDRIRVFFVTLHFKWSKYLRYSVSKFFLKPRSREKKKLCLDLQTFKSLSS